LVEVPQKLMADTAGVFLATRTVDFHKGKEFCTVVAIFIRLDETDDLL
jgi:hypothetical protein